MPHSDARQARVVVMRAKTALDAGRIWMGRSRTTVSIAAMLVSIALPLRGQAASGQGGRGAQAAAPAGAYTAAQANKGEAGYAAQCADCHLTTPHYGEPFYANWNGRTAYDLYVLVATTMPQNDPGILSADEYAAIVAYMLKINGLPAGKEPLPTDSAGLQRVKIQLKRGSRP